MVIPNGTYSFVRGYKFFELSNHLGNNMVVISDKKIGVDTNNDGNVDYYIADVVSANDYYPFGMTMPGRNFSSGNYRFGFNGQEKSDEIGEGLTTALFWEYDSRIGRRWNVDPVVKAYQSDYLVLSNSPIWKIDPNGDDDFFNSQGQIIKQTKFGTKIYVQTAKGVVLFSQVPTNNMQNRYVIANIVGHYANQVGITGIVGVGNRKTGDNNKNSNTVLAFTSEKKEVYVNAQGGGINSHLSDYNNLKNTLIHEKGHIKDIENNVKTNLETHVNVYLNAIKDPSFKKATSSFQNGIVSSFSNYLLNYYTNETNGDTKEINKYISDFNKNNKSGFSIQAILNTGNDDTFKIDIYKNNKTSSTVNITPIKDEIKKK